MSSKYSNKQPRVVSKQTPSLKELSILASVSYPRCTNCDKEAPVHSPRYSKCKCGGSYQLLKLSK